VSPLYVLIFSISLTDSDFGFGGTTTLGGASFLISGLSTFTSFIGSDFNFSAAAVSAFYLISFYYFSYSSHLFLVSGFGGNLA